MGGPVNFAAPVVTTASLSADMPTLGPGADASYVARAFDTVTGYEDQNNQCRVRVRLDDAGNDVTGQPNPPSALSAVPSVGGSVALAWTYNAGGQGGAPSQFHVYLWLASSAPDYSAPAATVAYHGDSPARPYRVTVSGLTGATQYLTACRAKNGAGEEANTRTTAFTALTAGPAAVQFLTATAIP